MGEVLARLVLGSEGVVGGGDVVVVVVLVEGDCVEEGIFLMSCWGAVGGEEYSMVFYLLGRDGLGGDVICI